MVKFTLFLIAILLLGASAHPRPMEFRRPASSPNRMKRDSSTPASTCNNFQCSASSGNCGFGSTLTFCSLGQHCDGSKCIDDLPLTSTCNPNAPENECAKGRCIDINDGKGPICQLYQEVMPGGVCSQNSQCYFSFNADGSGSTASTCLPSNVCAGRNVGENCVASHQCVLGSYCASNGKCAVPAKLGESCSDDSGCASHLTCLNNQCSSLYTQARGERCSVTDHCAPGLYCSNQGVCTAALDKDRTNTTCDIQSNNCPEHMECSCSDFKSANTIATCTPISGTYSDMPTIQKTAYQCLLDKNCGDDIGSEDNVKCIKDNCMSQYCTWFTRTAPEMFTDYPSCIVGRMVGSKSYADLLQSCSNFRPSRANQHSTSASSTLALPFALSTLLLSFILVVL